MRQLGAAILVATLAGCSLTPPEEDPVQIKLNDLETRLVRIERSNQSVVTMAQQLEASQAEVRRLRGRLEELENGAEALRKQQRDLYADLDKRLAGMTAGPAVGGAFGSTGSASAGEQTLYTQAFDALKTSNYPVAIGGFQTFLSSYPQSEMADNAQYWLGEAYYVTRDYERAGAAFRAVGEKWPNSRKAADALVKLGFTQFELKRFADARVTLNDVITRYPDSDAARLAAERLKRLPASAR
jgi:tol-pal system protein YbgF